MPSPLIWAVTTLATSQLSHALTVSKTARCGASFDLTCQGSTFGNCCSQAGYCGNTSAYCGYQVSRYTSSARSAPYLLYGYRSNINENAIFPMEQTAVSIPDSTYVDCNAYVGTAFGLDDFSIMPVY